MAVLKHLYRDLGKQTWGVYGFHDGFNQTTDWYDEFYMGLNQAQTVVGIENHPHGTLLEALHGESRNPTDARRDWFRARRSIPLRIKKSDPFAAPAYNRCWLDLSANGTGMMAMQTQDRDDLVGLMGLCLMSAICNLRKI